MNHRLSHSNFQLWEDRQWIIDIVSLNHKEMHHFMDRLILTFFCISLIIAFFLNHIYFSILLVFMQLPMRGSHPFLPWDFSYICCCCAVAHHHYVHFTAHLLLSVYLCIVHSPISPLGFCTGIDVVQIPSHRSLGPRCRDNDGENNKGRESKIKESMPPLPRQTPHYENKHIKRSTGRER